MKKILYILAVIIMIVPYQAVYASLNTHAPDNFLYGSARRLYAGDSASLSLSTDFTLEAWHKNTSDDTTDEHSIISKKLNNASGSYGLLRTASGGCGYSGVTGLCAWYSSSGGRNGTKTMIYRDSLYDGDDFTYHHTAFACDISESTCTLYSDGSPESFSYTAQDATAIADTGDVMNIGAGAAAGATYFTGKMDEVRIWSDIRTAQEIADNYDTELNSDDWGADYPNLEAYYKFNGTNGTDNLLDETDNNNDLTNVNSVTFGTDVPFAGSSGAAIIPEYIQSYIIEG